MGSWKNNFDKSYLFEELGVEDNVSSPTFSIVNEYVKFIKEHSVYHFDFYRLEDDQMV